MSYTDEPRGLQWVNNLNTATFGSLVTNACWFIGSSALTLADYQLLLGGNELARQAGLFLAGILVAAWGGKTVAGVVDSQYKRTANPAYKEVLEAKERGQAAAAARALALANSAADKRADLVTREHGGLPAVPAVAGVVVHAADQASVEVTADPAVATATEPVVQSEQEWASGDPRSGVL